MHYGYPCMQGNEKNHGAATPEVWEVVSAPSAVLTSAGYRFRIHLPENIYDFPGTVLSPGERTPVNLTEILAAECEAAGMELNAPEKGVEVRGDAGLVRSLCSNLTRNAVEAGADRMELVLEGTDPLELRLHDNGRGIPEDQRDKIWFPFFTTKEEGTGMGLALVRKIMNALDGDIKLEDSLEKGTEFRLTFFS